MTRAILDSSAVIAFLKREQGGAKVREVITGAQICTVNIAEVVGHFVRNGTPMHVVDTMLKPFSQAIVGADDALARKAGSLQAFTSSAGLSLGDRFCLAVAIRENLPAWTADRQWMKVADAIGVEVVLIG